MNEKTIKEKITEFYKARPFAITGCIVGIFAALFILLAGFWGTLLVLLFGGVGLWLGSGKDKGRDVAESVYRFVKRVQDIFGALFNR